MTDAGAARLHQAAPDAACQRGCGVGAAAVLSSEMRTVLNLERSPELCMGHLLLLPAGGRLWTGCEDGPHGNTPEQRVPGRVLPRLWMCQHSDRQFHQCRLVCTSQVQAGLLRHCPGAKFTLWQ